jgi:prepilin-type N-terminal cleavage/methylation domain-containing protein
MKKKQAFSLIELSIVILIIGILVAGVTSSSRLIRAMKLISAKQMTQSSPVLTIQDLLAWFEPTKEGIFGTGSAGNYTQQASPDNGQPIATWMDSNPRLVSGSQIVATQSSLSNQPLYVENGINGLPTLNFVDDDFLQYADNVGLNTGATLFVVFKASDYLTFRQIFVGGGIDLGTSQNGGNKCVALAHLNGASGSWYGSWNSSNALSYDTSSGMLCRFVYSKGIIQAFMNGSPDAQTNVGTAYPLSRISSPQDFTIDYIASQYIQTTLYNFHGYISELIVFGRGLKTDEISDIEKYLAKKYSIKLTY